MCKPYDFVGEVRGMGLMQAIEMVEPGTKNHNAAKANALANAARKHGLLLGKGGRYGNVMRIAPMLNVTAELIDEGCDLMEKALKDIA